MGINEVKLLGFTIEEHLERFGERLDVSSAADIPVAVKYLREKINARLAAEGVIIIDDATAFIAADAKIGAGTVIYPNCYIENDVVIGENCQIGPFAYIRPHSVVGNRVKIGDFVEIKNSTIGDGTKASHLTYVGDSDVGERVNFGCGTVTVNYDGKSKHRSTIGDDAFVGCNTNIVSPVTIGDGAYTAAGSTITRDVPPNALSIARSRQVNKEDWKDKRHG